MQSMSDKIETLILLIEKQQKENNTHIDAFKKADDRKRSDSIFIKAACTIVTLCAGFIVTNTMDISKKLESKADKHFLTGKLSSTAYMIVENQRAKVILDYIDYTSTNYLVRDEELRMAERGRVEQSLKAMVQMTTTRSGK